MTGGNSPDEPRPRYRTDDAQGVFERLVVAGGDAVDEAQLDRDGHDGEALAAGADDDLALHVEPVGAKLDCPQQLCGVEAEAALRIGDGHTRRPGDRRGREA